jgi:hypothetical protein
MVGPNLGVQEMLILVVIGVVVLGGIGVAIYFVMRGGSDKKED